MSDIFDSIDEFVEYTAKVENILSRSLTLGMDPTSHGIEVFERAIAEVQNPRKSWTTSSWNLLNDIIGGFREKEFTVFCGPTGTGKTTFLANLAVQLLGNNVQMFIASIEMGPTAFFKKMASCYLGENIGNDPERLRIARKQAPHIFGNRALTFSNYTSRIDHKQILGDILYAHEKWGAEVVIVDNLNFIMEVGDQRNQLMIMDQTIHDFVVFCKHVPVHIIMVMHPRKTEGGRVLSEFDIKGSSTAVQEACNVMLWNRVDVKNADASIPNPDFSRELAFRKIRHNGRNVGVKMYYEMKEVSEKLWMM